LTRSLRELKILFSIALALVCALRLWERIETLLIQPIATEKAVFGRVIAYPWDIERVDMIVGDAGVSKLWMFAKPAFPTPIAQCLPDLQRPRSASANYRRCQIGPGADGPGAEWDKGTLTLFLPAQAPSR